MAAGRGGARGGAWGRRTPAECVLTGGEEHALLACFPAGAALPAGWRPLGTVVPGAGVPVDGVPQAPGGGWDHFGG